MGIVQTWISDPAPANQGQMDENGTQWSMYGSPAQAVTAGNTLVAIGCCAALVGNTVQKATDPVNGDWTTLEHLNGHSGANSPPNGDGLDTILAYFPNTGAIAAGFMGKVTASGAGTLTATTWAGASPGWTSGQWNGATVRDGTGQTGVVSATTSNTLTFSGGATFATGHTFVVGGYTQFYVSNSEDYTATVWMEISGVTTSPLAGHSALQNNYGAGASFDSGSANLGVSEIIMLGFGVNDNDDGLTPYDPTADTTNGFTDDGLQWVFNLGSGILRLEHKVITNPGTNKASFVTRNSDHFQAFMVGLRLTSQGPSSGSLALSGNAPGLGTGIQIPSAADTLAGVAPSVILGTNRPIPVGLLGMTGYAPTLALGIITAAVGTLGLVGNAPTLATGNLTVTPPAGALALVGAATTVIPAVVPTTGTLSLNGIQSVQGLGLQLTSANIGNLGLAGAPPVVGPGIVVPSGQVILTAVNLRSPTIAASAGSLTLQGYAPTVGQNSPVMVPGTAALTVNSDPGVLTLSVPASPSANLVLGGYYPQLFFQYFISPGTGSLSLVGNSLGGAITNVQTVVPSGSMRLSPGIPPFLALTLNTPAGALGLSGLSPVVQVGTLLTPPAGALSLVGAAPTFLPGVALNPGAGAITVSGAAPTVLPAIVPVTGALAVTGLSATLNYMLAPPVSALGLQGAVPTVNGNATITPTSASLSFTGAPPVQGYYGLPGAGLATVAGVGPSLNLGLSPPAGALSLLGSAPPVSQAGLPLTLTGALSLSGYPPVLSLRIAPPSASLQLSSVLPVVNSLTTVTPLTGAVTLGSTASSVAQVGVILPPTGSLTFAGQPAQMSRQGYVAPATVSLNLQGNTPLVYQSFVGFVVPGTGNLTLSGQPAVNSLYTGDIVLEVTLPGPADYEVIL